MNIMLFKLTIQSLRIGKKLKLFFPKIHTLGALRNMCSGARNIPQAAGNHRQAAFARVFGIDVHERTPGNVKEMRPISTSLGMQAA